MKHYGHEHGFTLIELMIVVIIIAALAGMVVPQLIGRSDEMRRKIALGDIRNIATSLKLYRLDNDAYPTTEQGLKALRHRPSTAKNWKEPYLENDPNDPWGREYKYRYPGTHNTATFDVWSLGPDGQEGTEDDITNW